MQTRRGLADLNNNKVQYERVPWTGEEKLSVRMHFASYIMRGALPEKEVIEEFLEKQAWHRRSFRNIKDHIYEDSLRYTVTEVCE